MDPFRIVPIHRLSLWQYSGPKAVLVFPHALNKARLQAAFDLAAQHWPTVRGQYVRYRPDGAEEDEFGILLPPDKESSTLFIEPQTLHVTLPELIPTSHVEQPQSALDSLIPQRPGHTAPGSTEPLCLVRHTSLQSGESILGVVWSHVVGDADSLSRWLRLVSSFYVDPDYRAAPAVLTLPLEKLPQPTDEDIQRFRSVTMTPEPLAPAPIPHPNPGVPPDTPSTEAPQPQPAPPSSTRIQSDIVRFTLSFPQLDTLRSSLQQHTTHRLSVQDCLTAWWLTILERMGRPLSIAAYVINARSLIGCVDAGSNAVPVLDVQIPPAPAPALPPTTPSSAPLTAAHHLARAACLAETIRTSLLRVRDPSFHRPFLSVFAHDMYRLFAFPHSFDLADFDPDKVNIVNTHIKLDWTAASFGQPRESVRYHYAFRGSGTLHAAQANGGEGYEMSFWVDKGKGEDVEAMMRDDLAAWEKQAWGDEDGSIEP